MKTFRILSMALLAITLIVTSCSKYEEGPKFSLLPKKVRITGEWEVEKYVDADGDETSAGSNAPKLILDMDNTAQRQVEFFGSTVTVPGTWEFIDDKVGLRVTYDVNGSEVDEEYTILRLKNKELWLQDSNDNETHYIKVD